jgi:DNA-binding CsgD family transcriptional regulator
VGSLSALSTPQADELFQALLTRRSRPCVMVLDGDLNVAFADSHALALLETHFQLPDKGMLPVALRDTIAEIVRRWDENAAASEQSIGPVAGLTLRLVSLSGQYGSFYALLFEKEARREDLKDAVTRFSLTPREVEVLDLILDGMSAAEIAVDLHIAEVTVFDHFKHINDKTNARNRADMLAKIFNWQPALKSGVLGKNGVDRRISLRRQNDLGA